LAAARQSDRDVRADALRAARHATSTGLTQPAPRARGPVGPVDYAPVGRWAAGRRGAEVDSGALGPLRRSMVR
jgi:hypothetical protein